MVLADIVLEGADEEDRTPKLFNNKDIIVRDNYIHQVGHKRRKYLYMNK